MAFYPNDDNVEVFDRQTALRVLKDLSFNMHSSKNLYGQDTLVIGKDKFEEIRAKYLDKKENEK